MVTLKKFSVYTISEAGREPGRRIFQPGHLTWLKLVYSAATALRWKGYPRTSASKRGLPSKRHYLTLLTLLVWKRLQIGTNMLHCCLS